MKKIDFLNLHKRPKTRRDFIKFGMMAGGGLLLPSLFSNKTWAAMGSHVPFLVFDLSGGASMSGNFLVGKREGPLDLCARYEAHGWDPRSSGSLDETFGLPLSAQRSMMLRGLRDNLPVEIVSQGEKKYLQMASICNFSLDDTSDNRLSALSLVSKTGLVGEFLASGIGLTSNLSGGNSDVFLKEPSYKPKMITSIEDVLDLTSLGDRFKQVSDENKQKIYARFKELGANYPELAQAYNDLDQFGEPLLQGNPQNSPEAIEVYGNELQFDSRTQLRASIAFNVIQGYTGPGVITIEDCDYHDGTQETGDRKDEEIGSEIGKAISLAHKLGKPLFIQIITDGGVYASSDSYDRAWIGDQNQHSLSVMAYFDPTGSAEQQRLQLGHYTDSGVLSQTDNPVKDEEAMVKAVMANYLSVQGLLGQFENLTGLRGRADEIDPLICFS